MEKIDELQRSIDELETSIDRLTRERNELKTALEKILDIIKGIIKYLD